MTRIKICGLTRAEDAMTAAELGADALGFVFAERSKRRADPGEVAGFTGGLPPFVTLVGVFQDQPMSYVREVMGMCRLHVAQLHGNETARYMDELGFTALKAISLSSPADLEAFARFPGRSSFLLDSGGGGTGLTFDWSLAVKAKAYGKVVLAGGLTPSNVARAVATVRPWGVDTAGGVEKSPGIKDSGKIREFIRQVRAADCGMDCMEPKEVQ